MNKYENEQVVIQSQTNIEKKDRVRAQLFYKFRRVFFSVLI